MTRVGRAAGCQGQLVSKRARCVPAEQANHTPHILVFRGLAPSLELQPDLGGVQREGDDLYWGSKRQEGAWSGVGSADVIQSTVEACKTRASSMVMIG